MSMHDPTAQLEQALIEDYIRSKGHDPARLDALPAETLHDLKKEAAAYAAARLAEMEARAHYVHELHSDKP